MLTGNPNVMNSMTKNSGIKNPEMNLEQWVVYLVRCHDNSLYCGICNDIKRRLIEHNSGKGAKYTKSRRPVELAGISPEMTKSEALKLEYSIKQIPSYKKISELEKEGLKLTIQQDLKALLKEFKALGKKVENLTKAVEKSEKTQAKAAKAKTVKKATVKKTAQVKKKSADTKTKTIKAKKPVTKKKVTRKKK